LYRDIDRYVYIYISTIFETRARVYGEPIITFAFGRQFIYGGIVSRLVAPSTGIVGTLKSSYNLDRSAVLETTDTGKYLMVDLWRFCSRK